MFAIIWIMKTFLRNFGLFSLMAKFLLIHPFSFQCLMCETYCERKGKKTIMHFVTRVIFLLVL